VAKCLRLSPGYRRCPLDPSRPSSWKGPRHGAPNDRRRDRIRSPRIP
jgi:hypothetical protein